MSDGIRWGSGSPEVMVPFDLRRDVIDRLASVERKLDDVVEGLRNHVAEHAREMEERAKRLERLKQFVTWALGIIGGLISTLAVWNQVGR